ncbi:hypothetical protein MSAN_01764600 [Mycena sanguinolenta]|uniref:Uncharacterized protein n=1 Tax=Mycena sanguinolenta TaxID=230812 RepID=A0A8H6XU15_9AGAR|nr:hypothetical protein MSAN_01764600 [Mycena sanguinolenta]
MSVPAPAPLILLCTPIYAPDPGDEDREKHSEFHAIIHEEWKGAVTSRDTMVRMLKWNADCTEYHDHAGEDVGPIPASKVPSTSAPGLLPTQHARAREFRLCQTQAQDAANTVRTSARGTGDLVSRVFHSFPPGVPLGTFNSFAHVCTQQLSSLMRSTYGTMVELACGEGCERRWGSDAGDVPMLYAVSGHNRLFRSKDRAVAVLKSTPDAELAFSRDEDELLRFVKEYCTT